jgi:TPP-dependent pyruvate/acetoin dehydrogenase alpha subunit
VASRVQYDTRNVSRLMSAKAKEEAQRTPGLETQLDWLRAMHEIRFFEVAVERLYARGLVRGSTHLCQGQEAVAVGACRALREGDLMSCTYRGHGAVLAMGAAPERAFAEILGRESGLCGGKGGSMHLTDTSVGAFGSFAIVGAHLPIACGTAFAARYQGSDAVSLCFFGDGATNIGAFHEALNLASLWRLPVVFLCENNLYGEYSPLSATTAIERLVDRADSYAMRKAQVDGNVVAEVHSTVRDAVDAARSGEGPTLVEALTYRQKGHSRSDPGAYRPEGELERWLERDPIALLERDLKESGAETGELERIRKEAEATIAAAAERAEASAEPDPQTRFDHVWT